MDCADVVAKIKPSIALVITLDSSNNLLGTGSGFVYGESNTLVTCNHVVKTAASIVLKFPDATTISAKVVLRDDEHDLALLKFDDTNERLPLEPISEKEIREGMPVIFSGYPLSMQDLTTHQGILSAITKDEVGMTTYLIDGTVNSGNSGCPLMSVAGEVIGVVNAKRRESSNLLSAVERLDVGAVALHGIDLVNIYKALIKNVQLGIGYAVPASFIPEHKNMKELGVVGPPAVIQQAPAEPVESSKISEQKS